MCQVLTVRNNLHLSLRISAHVLRHGPCHHTGGFWNELIRAKMNETSSPIYCSNLFHKRDSNWIGLRTCEESRDEFWNASRRNHKQCWESEHYARCRTCSIFFSTNHWDGRCNLTLYSKACFVYSMYVTHWCNLLLFFWGSNKLSVSNVHVLWRKQIWLL